MAIRKPRHSPDEFVRRATEIYERVVKPMLKPEDLDHYVAIDIESDDFEIDPDDYTASHRLLARKPDAQIFIARVGHRAAYSMGGSSFRGESW